MNIEKWKSLVDEVQSSLSYLDDVSSEYEIDNPGYTSNLQEFKRKKERELDNTYSQLVDIQEQLDCYTDYVNKPDV